MTSPKGEGRALLAVAVAARTTEQALGVLEECAPLADIAELRLDLMRSYDLRQLIRSSPLPLIVTNRPPREGGHYDGDETARLAILAEAVTLGAAWIDVEGDAVAALRALLGRLPDGLIVSRHDFGGMPGDLFARHLSLAAAAPGGVPKVVGMARQGSDTAAILALLAGATRPTIAIAMGPAGLASRVLALRYEASFLTFAAPPAQPGAAPTAPGQVSLDAMHDVFHARAIGHATAAVGLICAAIDLPLLARYNRLLRGGGADAVCVPLQVSDRTDLDATLRSFTRLGLRAFVVDPTARAFVDLAGSSIVDVPQGVPEIDIINRDGDRLVGSWCGGEPDGQAGALLSVALRSDDGAARRDP